MQKKILVVDDEVNISELLALELSMEGYICEAAFDGYDAISKFESGKPDLVLLDLMLPGIDGIEVCSMIRKLSDVPVIMLTAKIETDDKIFGLKTGADDYITKPFDLGELLARIEALLRRYDIIEASRRATSELANGPLVLYPDSQEAKVQDVELHLTATEFDILKLFLTNINKAFSREAIAKELGITDFQVDTRSIDMHIQRLRKKLGSVMEEKLIDTVFGIGYKMRNLSESGS
ncbi:MAG: response regulator transcription factor [Eubacteriaceae bacterium]|nr:response regulator transcription factor [Eubacteriaceae bacterium]